MDPEEELQFLKSIRDAPYEERGSRMCDIHRVPDKGGEYTNEHWFLKPCIRKGLLPGMQMTQYKERKQIKGKMKSTDSQDLYVIYNAQQNAYKVVMNSVYGSLGTATNQLALFPAAETITYLGRINTDKCNKFLEENGWGKIVYNDTDSTFLKVPKSLFNHDPEEMHNLGKHIEKRLTALFPDPVIMEFENVLISLFIWKKKVYTGIKYDGNELDLTKYTTDHVHKKGLHYVKGFKSKKRDTPNCVKILYSNILMMILLGRPYEEISTYLLKSIEGLWEINNTDKHRMLKNIDLFTYNKGVSAQAKKNPQNSQAGQWAQMYTNRYGYEPVTGERFNIVIVDTGSGKHTSSAEKWRTVEWIKEDIENGYDVKLDVEHYLLCMEGDGNIIHILNVIYGSSIQRGCIRKWAIPTLKEGKSLFE